MSTIVPPAHPEADPGAKAVFDDIRATRQMDFINNIWHRLAFFRRCWSVAGPGGKRAMATPSSLGTLTKEMVYITASVINGRSYCVHSHAAAATAKGMKSKLHAERLSIIGLAAKTNRLATALQVPVDPVFVKG